MTAHFSRSAPLAEALRAATALVAAVLGGRNLDQALAAAQLAGVTRAAAMDLAWTALRAHGRGDALLARLMARPSKDKSLRALLLVALARLESRPEDAHTTVDQAVLAAEPLAGGRYKGVVNGVLRNFLRRREELLAGLDEVATLQHPAWWIERLRDDHPQHWREILAAGNTRPPMALRVNPRRVASPEKGIPCGHTDFQRALDEAGIAARERDGALILDRPVPVERIPGFAEGQCSVQDPGAQRAAPLLDAADGMRVLDACAAPGGKTAHLLERADLRLLALDAEPARAARIEENLQRLGLAAGAGVNVRVADARRVEDWWDGEPFDRILADVPCSASGVVRRHPDAKWLRRPEDIAGFAATQRAIVDALWRTLAPGGKMLYATCSVFREENDKQIDAFTGRHPDARLLTTQTLLPDADHDGFFYALLQKA